MESYFGLLRRHGFMLWISFLVGSIAAGIVAGILGVIIAVIGFFVLFAGTMDQLAGLESADPLTAFQVVTDTLLAPGVLTPLIIIGILLWLVFLLYTGFTNGGMYAMLREAVFDNRSSIETYFIQGFRYLWKMMGQGILIGLFYLPLAIPVVAGILMFVRGMMTSGDPLLFAGSILLFLVGLVLAALLALIFLHAPVILVAEHAGVWRSIALSARLFAKSFGQVFLSGLIVLFINIVPYSLLYIIEWWAMLDTGNPMDPGAAADPTGSIISIVMSLVQMVVAPLIQVVALSAVVYRYRKVLRSKLFPGANGNGATTPVSSA